MSHEEPGAAEHSSVKWKVMFDSILPSSGLSPSSYLLFSSSLYLMN